MCGRFTLTDDNRERVAATLGVPVDQLVEEDYRPRWKIAPADPHWIVRMQREDREALPAKWGLVQFGSKDVKRAAPQINARAETLDSRPAFRNAWRKNRRCVVHVDDWLIQGNTSAVAQSLLSPVADSYLVATPVSPRVNSVRNDDASCLEPVTFNVPVTSA